MRLKLIAPQYVLQGKKVKEVFPHLTLAYLAALTPPEWEVTVIDENHEEIDFDEVVDIVGISIYTYLANRAYAIADEYRRRGVTVVLGGIHPTVMREEASQHADAVVVGEAESIWTDLLADFKAGSLKRIYRNHHPCDLTNLPTPRFDLFDLSNYFNVFPLFVTRGCPYGDCNYCSISLTAGKGYRKRPISEVINEVTIVKERFMSQKPSATMPDLIFFVDDNIWGDVSYAKELFRGLIPFHIGWFSQGSILPCHDEELLKLAAESGCQLMLLGLETLHPGNLSAINKSFPDPSFYEEAIARLHQLHIGIQGSFMLGLPEDDVNTFDSIYDFSVRNEIEYPNLFILTPFPGTLLYNSLESEGKVLSKEWCRYDFRNLLFEPVRITRKKFKEAFIELNRRIFSTECIEHRLKNCKHFWIEHSNTFRHKYFYHHDWNAWINE